MEILYIKITAFGLGMKKYFCLQKLLFDNGFLKNCSRHLLPHFGGDVSHFHFLSRHHLVI